MSPAQHANLSPSAAERWISCPASVRVGATYPRQPDSIYAAEGTKAHALAELEASATLGKINSRQHNARFKQWLLTEPVLDAVDLEDMQRHVAAYVALVLETRDNVEYGQVLLEERVSTGIPNCWGTADCVVVGPDTVHIIDFKYGQGVPVSAIGNPQLRLYGVGALDAFGEVLGETRIVRMTVHQPRLDSTSTEELTADELRAWRDNLLPVAEMALGPDAPFGPSEAACRWCPAAGECRARMEKMTQEDFGRPADLLDPAELGDLLGRLSDIKAWCEAVAATALHKAYSEDVTIPGWKVVLSGGQRYVTDMVTASMVFENKGFELSEIMAPRKLKGIGDLEKVIKAKATGPKKDATLESVLGELVSKTPGKPSLAPDSDHRESASPNADAIREFS